MGLDRIERVTGIRAILAKEDLVIFREQDHLGGRGTRVDPKVGIPAIGGDIPGLNIEFGMRIPPRNRYGYTISSICY